MKKIYLDHSVVFFIYLVQLFYVLGKVLEFFPGGPEDGAIRYAHIV